MELAKERSLKKNTARLWFGYPIIKAYVNGSLIVLITLWEKIEADLSKL
jgi:hypothetical protein